MEVKFNKKQAMLNVELDTSSLGPAQLRLVKSINAALARVLNSESEAEFFNGSAELMRLAASLIQQANFVEGSEIPYADQVLEFSVDALQEQISSSKVVTYDN